MEQKTTLSLLLHQNSAIIINIIIITINNKKLQTKITTILETLLLLFC